MNQPAATPTSVEASPTGPPLRTPGHQPPLTTRFCLEPVSPFRLDLTVWALRRRPTNVVDRWDGSTYRRAMRLGGTVAEVEVRQTGPTHAARLDVSVTTGAPVDPAHARAETTATSRRLLGIDVDLAEFYRRARLDPLLDPLAERSRGLKPPRFPTMFECLANPIACQQLTLNVGIVLLNGLAKAYGPTAPTVSGAASYAFPDAVDLTGGTSAGLRELGLSIRKAESLLELASHVADGGLDFAALSSLTDDTVCAALQQLRGVGRWSAEYALLRGFGRLAVFPGDDVGARNNLARRMHLHMPLNYDRVRRVVAAWAPFAGLAYFHLLVERIDGAGWLGDAEAAPRTRLADHHHGRRP
jgi:DNA-3-methyladenine glycosylase II